jgi:hypothetical protein
MTEDAEEKLLVELKRVSTKNLAGERDAFVAMPSAIERAISEHSDRIDPALLRPYYKRAKSHFDKLAETLRRASLLLCP